MEKERKLPESITLEDEYNRYRSSWLAVINSAQKAFDSLLADKDVGDCLPAFEQLDYKWVSVFVAEKIELVMKSPTPYNERMKSVGLWQDLERDVKSKIKKVKAVYGLDPKVKVELRNNKITITNLDELLSEKAKFQVPESYKSYYEKIVNLEDAVEQLHNYEKENGLRISDPNFILRMVKPLDYIEWREICKKVERFAFVGCQKHK